PRAMPCSCSTATAASRACAVRRHGSVCICSSATRRWGSFGAVRPSERWLIMDVMATRAIAARPGRVAAVMFDPRRDPEWIGGAKSVAAPKGDPTKIGARVTRHGGFMGKKFSWMTEVAGHDPDHLLHMNFIEGQMKGGTGT